MRVNADKLLKEVKAKGMKYIFQKSKPMAVMMNMVWFKRLLEAFEDMSDQELVRKIEKEGNRKKGWTSLNKVIAQYGEKL